MLAKRHLAAFAILLGPLYLDTAFAVSYTETFGLMPPQWEGGRTEFEMADLNQDGHVDLVSIGDHGSPYINTGQHGIMVWLGDGACGWTVHMYGNFGYGGVAVGDVNNDGLYDVGYSMHHNYSSSDLGNQLIEVALGDGSGFSWTPWDDGLATNGESWGMFGTDFGDVNHNGLLDLVSNSFGSGSGVHVYLNQGDGSWVQSFGFTGGNSTDDVVFGDVDNDGHLDFAVAHQYGTVYRGDGAGGFTLTDSGLPPMGTAIRKGIALGDVNNDGGSDLAFVNLSGGVEIWLWDVAGQTWIDFGGSLPASGPYQATQLYDMNVDGRLDLAAFGGGQFKLWLGDGDGNWIEETQFSTPSSGSFAAFRVGGDVDHNGYPDLVIVAREGSWPNDENEIHFFKETSVPDRLTVAPLYPRGSELLWENSVCFVDWASGIPTGHQDALVKLELSTDGAGTPWTTFADSLPNNGRFQWVVPSGIWSDQCRIQYTLFTDTGSVTAVTARDFSIHGEATPVQEGAGPDIPPCFAVRNHPNPFNPRTTIAFDLPLAGHVSLRIFDVRGRLIRTLVAEDLPPGHYQRIWDGKDISDVAASAGTYLYQLRVGTHLASGMATLVK